MNLFQATAFPFTNMYPAPAWAGLKIPVLRMEMLFEMHRKNATALTHANEIVFEGLTRLAQGQAELFTGAVNDYTKVTYGALAGRSFEERSTDQINAVRHIYGSNVTRLQEVADIAVETNIALADVLNTRISEAFDDFRALFSASVAPVAALSVEVSPAVAEPVVVVEEATVEEMPIETAPIEAAPLEETTVEETTVDDPLTLEKSETAVSPPSKKTPRSRKTTRRPPGRG